MKPSQPTIRWKEIYEKYPKAWKIFWDWITSYDEICQYDIEVLENSIQVLGGGEFTEFTHFNRGDLYSFFDARGLVIEIIPEYTTNNIKPVMESPIIDQWKYKINGWTLETLGTTNRKLAEEAAFEKTFNLLNTMPDGPYK